MTEIQNKPVQEIPQEEQEIDLIALVLRFWEKRVFILKITAGFMVLGLLVALLSPKQYSASTVITPQISDSKASGGIAAAASMLGISMGGGATGEPITPKMYPMLLNNADLQKDLIYSKFQFADQDTLVSFIDYFTAEAYNPPTFMGTVKKYTIGLPGVILAAIRGGDNSEETVDSQANLRRKVHKFTKEEEGAIKTVKGMVSVAVNDKDGYVTISATAGEPRFVADLTQRVTDLMQKYVTAAKVSKAQANYDFVKARFADAEEEYQRVQMEYARFMDANKNITSAVAMTKRTVLEREYQFASNLYNEVSRLLLQADIKVKEDTPTFSVVQPVVEPLQRSKPRRSMILVVFTFFGGCLGCGAVLGLDFLKHRGSNWPKGWTLPEEKQA